MMQKKEDISLTDLYFFDTDSLSSFLCIDEQYLIEILYENKIIIPKPVYIEIGNAAQGNGYLKKRLDQMVKEGKASIWDIEYSKEEFDLYRNFVNGKNDLKMAIGKGEASCLALAIAYNGTIVSNNLKDIKRFVKLYGLKHLTVASVLKQAYDKKLISLDQGNRMWEEMLANKRKIGPESNFDEYLERYIQ